MTTVRTIRTSLLLPTVACFLIHCSVRVIAQETPPADVSSQSDTATAVVIKIDDIVKQLYSDRFKERQSAEQALLRLGKSAIPMMEAALNTAAGEAKVRLKRILDDLHRSIRLVETHQHPTLNCVTSATISDDGRFLYTAAWKANAISAFSIDPKSGRLTFVEAIQDANDLHGAVSLRLSDDNRWAAVTSFNARTVTLLRRDENTGKLNRTYTVKPVPTAPALTFPIEAAFSPGSQYLYVLDTNNRGAGTFGAIFVYRVTNHDTLELVETNVGQQNCFHDARGIAFHPSLDLFYVAAGDPGQLVRVEWDRKTGLTQVRQVVHDEQLGVSGLSGVMGVAISTDGKFLYSSSGRFRGDSAVSAFQIADDGKLTVLEERISGRDPMGNFLGGNELLVSADGKNVYATATRSATLAGFSRDVVTGKLEFIETVSLGGKELGPAGVAIGPDGEYLYVAVEGSGGIAVFRRD